jgi:hypothetical protein
MHEAAMLRYVAVVPAKAGIHFDFRHSMSANSKMGPGSRRDDKGCERVA